MEGRCQISKSKLTELLWIKRRSTRDSARRSRHLTHMSADRARSRKSWSRAQQMICLSASTAWELAMARKQSPIPSSTSTKSPRLQNEQESLEPIECPSKWSLKSRKNKEMSISNPSWTTRCNKSMMSTWWDKIRLFLLNNFRRLVMMIIRGVWRMKLATSTSIQAYMSNSMIWLRVPPICSRKRKVPKRIWFLWWVQASKEILTRVSWEKQPKPRDKKSMKRGKGENL